MPCLTDKSVFLLDLDGTMCLGDRLLPGAKRLLDLLTRQGKRYFFMTNNSSRNNEQYAEKFSRLKIDVNPELIITSIRATMRLLTDRPEWRKIFLLGTPGFRRKLELNGWNVLGDESSQQPDAVVVGFDTDLTYHRLWRACCWIESGRPWILSHPDTACPSPEGKMPDAGALAAAITAATGTQPIHIAGKPHRWMVETVIEATGASVEELAIVGDNLPTDLAMAQRCGAMGILVLTGRTDRAILARSPIQPDLVVRGVDELADQLEEKT